MTSQSSVNQVKQCLETNPYIGFKKHEISSMGRTVELGLELIAEIRKLAFQAGNIYVTPQSREDAIWRTALVDQGVHGRDNWTRPAESVYFFQILSSCWSSNTWTLPPGLQELADRARIKRAYGILSEWGFFSDLDLDTVQDMFYGRGNLPRKVLVNAGPDLTKALILAKSPR